KFDSNGNTVGSEVQFDGYDYDTTQITALTDGGFIVTWQIYHSISPATDIFVQKFDSSWEKVGSEIQLDGQGGYDNDSQITALADGGFAVTWDACDSNYCNCDTFVQKFDSNGNRDGLEIQLDGQGGSNYNPQITALTDGGYVATWGGNYDIFVQKFDSNGNRDGSEIQLDGQGSYDGEPQITALTDGGYVVAWVGSYGNGDSDTFVQKFDSNGNTVGSEVQFDGYDYDTTQITALTDGGFYSFG
ncbi:MAG: hypothetical protein IE883_08190, partial [Epsilonproteobacteria bacterium]|nr:hypothetical protein [Campylobacterota bacterium]